MRLLRGGPLQPADKRCSSCGDGRTTTAPQRDFFAQVVGAVALVLLIATLVALVVSKKLAIREKERLPRGS